MMYRDFKIGDSIIGENSTVLIGTDGTCVKQVFEPKCFSRLENEVKCLEILNGRIAPKMIEYNSDRHSLHMEYIEGYPLCEYINKYGRIPKYFFAKVVSNLLKLLDYGIEYGGDRKIAEHFIIIEETNDVRIIDFGLSRIVNRDDIINNWKECYKKEFAFVFNTASSKDIEQSMNSIRNKLYMIGISKNIVEQYFEDYDKL